MIQRKSLIGAFKPLLLVIGIIALLSSCGDKKQSNEVLQQAFELHKEAIEIRLMTKDQMAQLKANKDSLFLDTYSKELDAISSSLEAWDEQLVEVPGFEDEHDHSHHDHSDHDHGDHDHGDHDHGEHDHGDHDHHHHHNDQQDLTPKQHLEVQQFLLDEIKAIAERINSIK